jgi:hypothetical protein
LLPSLILVVKGERRVYRSVLLGAGTVTVISLLMATPASLPLWSVLPLLKQVQMPWRWMAVSSMGASVLVAVSIPAWWKIAMGTRRALALLAAGLVMVSVAFNISHPIREASYHPKNEVDNISISLHGFTTIGPWFPLWAGSKFPVGSDQIVEDPSAEDRTVREIEWSSEHRKYSVSAGAASEVPVRTFFYPWWVAAVDGKRLGTRPGPDGVLLISVPPEQVTLSLDFREPRRSLVFGIVSIVGWLTLLVLTMLERKPKVKITDEESAQT